MVTEILVPAIVSLVVALIGIFQVPLETRSDLRKLSSLVESAERLRASSRDDRDAVESLEAAIKIVASNIETNEIRSLQYAVYGEREASDAADKSMPGLLKALLWFGLVALLGGAAVGLVAGVIGTEWQEVPLVTAIVGWMAVISGAIWQVVRETKHKREWRREFIKKHRETLLATLKTRGQNAVDTENMGPEMRSV